MTVALFCDWSVLHTVETGVLFVVEKNYCSTSRSWWLIIRKFWTVTWYLWYSSYLKLFLEISMLANDGWAI